MIRERYNPLDDPEAVPCPAGCGWLSDDPYGGPCRDCRAKLGLNDAEPRHVPFRYCDHDCMDIYPPARTVVTVRAAGGLL